MITNVKIFEAFGFPANFGGNILELCPEAATSSDVHRRTLQLGGDGPGEKRWPGLAKWNSENSA